METQKAKASQLKLAAVLPLQMDQVAVFPCVFPGLCSPVRFSSLCPLSCQTSAHVYVLQLDLLKQDILRYSFLCVNNSLVEVLERLKLKCDLIFFTLRFFILVFTSISLFCFVFCCYDKMPTKNTLVRKGLVTTSRLQSIIQGNQGRS